MTVLILCHSEEAQRADVGIRPFYDGRGFGPPYLGHGLRRPNFVPKFGASVRSSAPTKRRDSCRNHPSQRRTAERLRRGHEEWAGIDARTIPKGGPPPRLPRQRLAKRKARKEQLVKFDFCPMTSECSTAHKVRKSQHGHARVLVGAALIGQDSLAPRPAARQGASRARNCAATSVFSFDGSTAVFFLPPAKRKWGWKAAKLPWHPPVGRPAHRVARRCRGLDGAGERWYNKLF